MVVVSFLFFNMLSATSFLISVLIFSCENLCSPFEILKELNFLKAGGPNKERFQQINMCMKL